MKYLSKFRLQNNTISCNILRAYYSLLRMYNFKHIMNKFKSRKFIKFYLNHSKYTIFNKDYKKTLNMPKKKKEKYLVCKYL